MISDPTTSLCLPLQGHRMDYWNLNGTQLAVLTARTQSSVYPDVSTLRQLIDQCLPVYGGLLLRGFAPMEAQDFKSFAAALSGPLLQYEYASSPRSKITEGVYSSTEYPADQWIPQHNEQSYTDHWPLKIWFYCVTPAASGGATPLTDSRTILRNIAPETRVRFQTKRLMYVRNYGNGLDLPWSQVFQTSNKAAVETFCLQRDITCEWLSGDRLRTRQICHSEARHPVTHEELWFNQAHLFHISALPAALQEAMLEVVEEEDLPRNVYYADGSRLEKDALAEIRAVYEAAKLIFTWRLGDLLLLDNMLMAHGRAPFAGARRVIVSMAQPFTDKH